MAKVRITTEMNLRTADGIPLITEKIPAKVMDEMLRAEADVVEPRIRENARRMLNEGGHSTGATEKAVTRRKPTFGRGDDGKQVREILITFTGTRDDKTHRGGKDADKRNAAIAFINEFGSKKRGVRARKFIEQAVVSMEKAAQDAGEAVFEKWAKNNV